MKYIVEYKNFRKTNIEQINEGLAQGLLSDAIQFLIAGAAEYGIAAGTLGVGTPAATVVETIIDASFAAESIYSTIQQITNLKGQLGEFTEIINKCMEAFETFKKGDLAGFYQQVKQVIIDGLNLIEGSEEGLDKIAEKLKKLVSDLISKLTDAVSKGLKMLIPDATVGATLSAAIKVVVESVSDKGYDLAKKGVEQLGQYKKYLIDPSQLPLLIKKTLPDLYNLIEQYKKKIEELGWVKAIAMFGANGLILKKMGPNGLNELTKTIKGFEPKVLDLIEKILGVIVPVTFTILAVSQILLKGEYKKEKEEKK